MRKARWIIASFVAFALVAAACGDDGEESSPNTTAAPSGAAQTTVAGGGAAASCTIDRSPKLIGLAEKPPEGPNAIPDYSNGWELAIDQVNAKGGICGKKIEYERLPASPTDNNAAKTNLLTALDKKADVMMGIPNSATVIALAADFKAGGTPILLGSASVGIFLGAANSIGSEWTFVTRPRNAGLAIAQADYLTKDLGKKNIGLVCATQPFGVQSCDAAKPAIEAAGAKVGSRQDTDVSATNLTTQVLAMKNAGVDAVLAFQFPNVIPVLANQMVENGLNVPVLAGASAGLGVATKNVKPDALKILYGLDDCAPASEDRAKEFAAAYRAKYNLEPGYAAAESYDSIYMIAAAITKAGKLDKKAIADALRQTDYKGACDDYKTDAGQGLHHRAVFETFNAQGVPQVTKQVAIPAPAGGG